MITYLEYVVLNELATMQQYQLLTNFYLQLILKNMDYSRIQFPFIFPDRSQIVDQFPDLIPLHNFEYSHGRDTLYYKWAQFHSTSMTDRSPQILLSFTHPNPLSALPLYVQKLLSLLSSFDQMISSADDPHAPSNIAQIRSNISREIVSILTREDVPIDVAGKNAILLVCYSFCDFPRSVNLMINNVVPVDVGDFASEFCRSSVDWSELLHILLTAANTQCVTSIEIASDNSNNSDGNSGNCNISGQSDNENVSSKIDYYSAYQVVLKLTGQKCGAEAMLGMLPSDGNLQYFYPLIKTAFLRCQSEVLRDRVIQDRKTRYLSTQNYNDEM